MYGAYISQKLSKLMLHVIFMWGKFYYSHFIDEEREKVKWLIQDLSWQKVKLELELKQFSS